MDQKPRIGATYLPMEFRHAVAQGRTLPEAAAGAALFSDFSGFTDLSGSLTASYGTTRGAERLAELLRGAFDGIIAAIHNYRGSIIGFSGDAVTVWFDDECGTEMPGTIRAVAAAKSIHDFVATLPEFRIDDAQRRSIGVKVSVSSGSARRYVVGDPAIQQMAVFAGDTLQRLALADDLAEAGDLILDSASYERCESLLRPGSGKPSQLDGKFISLGECTLNVEPCPWPDTASLSAVDIQSWLLADVAERLQQGAAHFLGAFKPIAAIFLKFHGIDYDNDPGAGRELNTLVSRIQQVAADYGGHLVDITIGDKGSYVFIAFGALQTHENDAARAVAAVAELRRSGAGIHQLRDAAIGVARGSVYVGEYGGSERRTFGTVGRDIIIAARLMSNAEAEQTLVTPHIAELAAPQFSFEQHGTVKLKGIEQPMPVFRFDSLGESKVSSPISALATDRLVGRENECEIIDEMIAATRDQAANTLVIEGDPGIGKSRVLEYLLQQGTLDSRRMLIGASDAIGSTSRYHAWRNVFGEVLSLSASMDSAARAASAKSYVEENLPQLVHLVPLLSDVIDVDISETELTRNMAGQVREDNTTDLLVQLLADYAREDVAIVILEDGHWFDSASAALLLRASDELTEMLIVVTRRSVSDEYSANAVYNPGPKNSRVMRLGPLASEAVETLIADVLQVDTVPPELHEFVVDKAQGSPFFSRELTVALRDAEVIVVDGRRCILAGGLSGLEQADFPFTIQGAIGSRIDKLPATQQLVLKVGSVVGRQFDEKIIHELLPSDLEKHELQESLAQLDRADLIESTGSTAGDGYVFRHVLTQEVAYSMLLHNQRVVLHERAAGWYEAGGRRGGSQHLPLLAHHWSRAALEQPGNEVVGGKAVECLVKAADQGISGNANHEATQFINDAITIDDQLAADVRTAPLQRSRWFATLAHAYHALGDETRCRVAVESGLTCADAPLPRTSISLAFAAIAQIFHQARHRLSRLDIYSAAVPDDRKEAFLAQCVLYRSLSRALWGSNESLLMLYANFRNLNLSERLGPSAELAVIYSHMVMTLGVFQMPKWGSWYHRRSLEVSRETDDMGALATVLVGLGVNEIGTGNWSAATQTLQECLHVCSRLSDTKQWAEAASLQGDAALLTGDFEKGLACYLDVYGRAERKGSLGHMGLSLRTQAMIALRQGKLEEAGQLLTKAEHVLAETTEKLIQIDVSGLQALVELQSGDATEAFAYLQNSIRLIGETMPPIAYPRIFGLRAVSRVLLDMLERSMSSGDAPASTHELTALARKLERYLKAYQRIFKIGAPITKIHSARLLWLRGRHAAASREIGEAIAAAERLQMQPDLDDARALATTMARVGSS